MTIQTRPVPATVSTTCPYCGVGCGVKALANGQGGADISGDESHPANFGRLCSKGSALGETLEPSTRLLHPEMNGAKVTWDTALDHVASEMQRVRERYGPEAIAFYLSGQLLTEDYYAANKLAKGFIGTPHVDTNSRLCMASSVAGHKRAFGADVVPGCYEDLDEADVVVLVGSNTAWCHPILYQRLQKARQSRGSKVINIDPRRTATSEGADLHLSLQSGSDTCLWNGLLVWLADHHLINPEYIASHTEGFENALKLARDRAGTVAKVAFHTGLSQNNVREFFQLWSSSERVVSCYSQGVNQAIQGTDKVNAIINCHLATGRIAKPGSGPFSLTGQPNAMGGREVGGLANMLAAHMGFSEPERDLVRRFWNAPHLVASEGLKAVQMFDAIDRGQIKALWVMGTNPAVSLPRADAMRAAMAKLELLCVSEVVAANDTMRDAGVRLPAHGWGEKDGTVTNSERRISRQRAFMKPAGDAKPDWWILSRVAERMGWGEAFAFQTAGDIFREHAALSGFENSGQRVFNISGLASLSNAAYETLEPIQWPVLKPGEGQSRVFADGRFATPSGRARLIAVARNLNHPATSDKWPMVLNTGRIRDQWHTMTRTGIVPRLSVHIAEPFVEVHPLDAESAAIQNGGLARIETSHGAAVVRAHVTDTAAPGTLFAPIHWSDENSSHARIGALVHSVTDAISGQPDLKATPARVSAVEAAYFGFWLTRSPQPNLDDPSIVYWSRANIASAAATTFAIDGSFAACNRLADSLLNSQGRISLIDEQSGTLRAATAKNGCLQSVLFIGRAPDLQPSQWLKSLFAREQLSILERRALLSGQAPDGATDHGSIVCVCHQVGAKRITQAIAQGCTSTDSIGKDCAAGTNCGSCLPELNRMIRALAVEPSPAP